MKLRFNIIKHFLCSYICNYSLKYIFDKDNIYTIFYFDYNPGNYPGNFGKIQIILILIKKKLFIIKYKHKCIYISMINFIFEKKKFTNYYKFCFQWTGLIIGFF